MKTGNIYIIPRPEGRGNSFCNHGRIAEAGALITNYEFKGGMNSRLYVSRDYYIFIEQGI